MALQFICNTCERIYQVDMLFPLKNVYTYNNEQIVLETPNDDCPKCKAELDEITANAREKARQELKEKKRI